MKAARFILALVATASRWSACGASEKQKLLHFHTQSLEDEIEDLEFEEFCLCLRLFSRFFQDSLPESLNQNESLSYNVEKGNIHSFDSKEELLLENIRLLTAFMKNRSCQEYLQILERSHDCFPVVAYIVLSLLNITLTSKLEFSLRVSSCATLGCSFCPYFSVSVATSVLPGLVSKLCKLASESFYEHHRIVTQVLDCLRIFIMKCFPMSWDNACLYFEPRVDDIPSYTFLSVFKRQKEMMSDNTLEQPGRDKYSTDCSIQLEKAISCLQFMLHHKNGPVFHPHLEVHRKTVQFLEDILLRSQVGSAKNLRIFIRSLCRLCSDFDTETRLMSLKALRLFQERISPAPNYDLNSYKEEEISTMLERATLCKDLDEFEDDDFIIFFNVAEFLIDSWITPTCLRKPEDVVSLFIRIGEKFMEDLFTRISSDESIRIFTVLRDITDVPFEADHLVLRRYFACLYSLGMKGALDWFFPLVLRDSETEENVKLKVISAVVCSQMFLGAMKNCTLEESCRKHFFPELLDFLNGLMQRLSALQETEYSDVGVTESAATENLNYLLLFWTEGIIEPNATIFGDYLLKSLISFVSLMGHRRLNIANETRRILSKIVCKCGYEDVLYVLRKYLNYLIDIICEKFIHDGEFYPALQVLLNTDEKLTKDCVVLAAKELTMLLETIPYFDRLQTIRFMKLVDCTMKRCAPAEQVPISKSFPYRRPAREPGLYSDPSLLREKLESLRLSMTGETEMNSNDSGSDSLCEEEQCFESPMVTSETLGKNEITDNNLTVEDSIVSNLAEKTIQCCIELLSTNEIPAKILYLKAIASSLDVLAMNPKKLLPTVAPVLNAVNSELASWNVNVGSARSRRSVDSGQEDFVYRLLKSENSLSIKQQESTQIPNISLLDGLCEVIVQIIRYTGDFAKTTISNVALPKLLHILKSLVAQDSVKFWESTLYSGYALSSFRCLELVTSLEVTLVGGFIQDLVEIVVPILSLYTGRMRQNPSRNHKREQRYEEKLKVLYELSTRILKNLALTDPSTTWYCIYRKLRK
ncbi:hypothetical protein GpartN1_g416.t1 [Galdieria partita]|uniref:TTI1 N-terminal TPR domain-containing protein n=1 Tax=Galdieria partita TaxID=83374 RepID=A0A9C7PQJ4_9RHOD|nr:hypothetical protein GpartN1_g416.t1 [Galdieria partita]